MADIQELLSHIPIADLAAKLGVDEATASEVVGKAVPVLLGGMQANAASGGAASLEKAVSGHTGNLVKSGVKLDKVDTAEGKKIVSHVFGAKKDEVATAVGSGAGSQIGDLVGKALPILAPIVMSYLGQKFAGQQKASNAESSGGGIADLLGGLLGGGSSTKGGGLADLLGGLGGLLGGGSK